MYFLSFFLWNNLRKNQKKEKKILYTCLNFLHALPIRYIGIVGFKILIKGKLFKKPRKKTFKLFKGKLSLQKCFPRSNKNVQCDTLVYRRCFNLLPLEI